VAVTEVTSSLVIKFLGPANMVDEIGTGTSFDQTDIASDTTYDTFLTEQITIISDTVEAYCGRKFLTVNAIETFYVDTMEDLTEVTTYGFPIQIINSIKEDGVDITDYRLNKNVGIISNPQGLVSGQSAELVVDYDCGFTDTPSPVKSVVYSLVEERYNKKKSGVNLNFGSDVQRISIPGTISIDFDYSLQSNERKIKFGTILGNFVNVLDSYRSERVISGTGKLVYVEEVP
jgi:hypothetical protein